MDNTWESESDTFLKFDDDYDEFENSSRCNSRQSTKPVVVTYAFVEKDSYKIPNVKNPIISVNYSDILEMFIIVDTEGILTWRWKMFTHKIKRIKSKEFLKVIYCTQHGCYIGLKKDGHLALLNRNFEEVHQTKSKLSSTVLCMVYNHVTDELLTSCIDGLRIWRVHVDSENFRWKSVKHMCNDTLRLEKEWLHLTKDWIKMIEIDPVNCHIYCCSDTSLYIYDFNGNLLRQLDNCHELAITTCVYSFKSKCVLTGSLDGFVKVWTLTGGLVETFRAHSRPVTRLILNPLNCNLVLSASLDGSLKMWSLDIMQLAYHLKFEKREILWMDAAEDNSIYVAFFDEIKVLSIPNFIDFSAVSKDKIKKIYVVSSNPNEQKTHSKLLTLSEENTLRIYSKKHHGSNEVQVTSVMPIPVINDKNRVMAIAFAPSISLLYILIENSDVWLYYTKTNPCTKVAIWNSYEMQQEIKKSQAELEMSQETSTNVENATATENSTAKTATTTKPTATTAKKLNANYEVIKSIAKKHRSLEINLSYTLSRSYEMIKCRSLATLESSIVYWTLEGPFSSDEMKLFILLGLENGVVLFCDPLVRNKKYSILNCGKEPVIEITHNKTLNQLVTRLELNHLYHVQYWSLPNLELVYHAYCSKEMTAYSRTNDYLVVGYQDGSIEFIKLRKIEAEEYYLKNPNEPEMNKIIAKLNSRFEHKQRVESIDVFYKKEIFISCSYDGCIKVWTWSMQLLGEINLDETLSSCCFFSQTKCDLILTWKTHIFTIQLAKLIPRLNHDFLNNNDDNDDSEGNLEDTDSIIIEDPKLKSKKYEPEPIDLNNYLHPFDVKLSDSGRFIFSKEHELLSRGVKKITQTGREPAEVDQDANMDTPRSVVSSIPASFYTSPRTNQDNPQLNLQKVDLLLDGQKLDLHKYLIEIFAECSEEYFPNKWKKFPKFGASPTSDPSRTPSPPETPKPEVVKEEKSEEVATTSIVEQTKSEKEPILKAKKKSEKIDYEAELERKLRERMPVYEKSKLMEIKIDSKQLIASVSISASTLAQQQKAQRRASRGRRSTLASEYSAGSWAERASRARVEKRKSKAARSGGRKRSAASNSSSQHRSVSGGEEKRGARGKKERDEKKKSSKHHAVADHHHRRRGEENQQVVDEASTLSVLKSESASSKGVKVVEGRIMLPRTDSASSTRFSQKHDGTNDIIETELVSEISRATFDRDSITKISSNLKPGSPRDESSIIKPSDESTVNEDDERKSKSSKPKSSSSTTSADLNRVLDSPKSPITVQNKENQPGEDNLVDDGDLMGNKEAEIAAAAMARRDRLRSVQMSESEKRRVREERERAEKIEKTKILFDFVRGKSGPPIRVKSGVYRLPFGSIESNLPHQQQQQQPTETRVPAAATMIRVGRRAEEQQELKGNSISELLTHRHTKDHHLSSSSSQSSRSNAALREWLLNYEINKIKRDERFKRAKFNQSNQMLWKRKTVNSAAESRSASTMKIISQSTRQQKESLFSKNRPKSVSFAFVDGSSHNKHLREAAAAGEHIRMQPAYLVSQIEMEAIMQEVNARINEKKLKEMTANNKTADSSCCNSSSSRNRPKSHSRSRGSSREQQMSTTRKNVVSESEYDEDSIEYFNLDARRSSSSMLQNSSARLVDMYRKQVGLGDNSNLVEHRLSMRAFSGRPSKSSTLPTKPDANSNYNSTSESDSDTKKPDDRALRSSKSSSKFYASLEPNRGLRTPNSIPNRSSMSNYNENNTRGDRDVGGTRQTMILASSSSLLMMSPTSRARANQIDSAGGVKSPSLFIEYQIPCSPEKYLLPIRFPVMYENIVRNLLKHNKAVKSPPETRPTKIVRQKDNGLTYVLLLG